MAKHPDELRDNIPERRAVLVHVGATLRALRTASGFSQEAFADACQIDRSYMGGVERGVRNLSTANLLHIISALHIKPSEFFKAMEKNLTAHK